MRGEMVLKEVGVVGGPLGVCYWCRGARLGYLQPFELYPTSYISDRWDRMTYTITQSNISPSKNEWM